MIKSLFNAIPGTPARVAIFMSGAGSNADALLRYCAENPDCNYISALLVTDSPKTSRAGAISAEWGIPLIEHDIRAFYAERGESVIALTSERRREIRAEWTDVLRQMLLPCKIDFGVLAGFVPLCNITKTLPCLNVHPGDLTIERDGRRIFAGLHFRPVENAILAGNAVLRSSVILAQPFKGGGEREMDSGPILGVSRPVPIELGDETIESLTAVMNSRTVAPYCDKLREVATFNLERLKILGDHVVLPQVVDDFAGGKFGIDEHGQLYFKGNSHSNSELSWTSCRTVEYDRDSRRIWR
ncbi:MAG: hypothetical protein LBM70_08575 [Victivallales bacterium]|nr:hypothetical protein [Victivallales bacterium]